MAQVILMNNIHWDWALLKQVQCYKQDGIVPWLADKNFTAIVSAVTIDPSSKVTFVHKGTTYEIIPYEDISEWLDSIMANLVLAVHCHDCLYKRIQALNLLGISWPSDIGYGSPNSPMHPAAQGAEACDCPVQTGPTRG